MLSIIIVTYNAKQQILNCLDSIKNFHDYIKNELILIDNDSEKNIAKIIKKTAAKIKLIKNTTNIGFAAAANQGAKRAMGKHLLFLNPDTVVKSHSIEEMVRFLERKKDAAVVGCKILNRDGSLQPSCGNFPTITNIILDRIPMINKMIKTELIRQEDFYITEQNPDWVSGAFFLTRKDVFQKLGGFDEKYFMYVEDIDFCYRAREAGYKMYYNPKAEIIHYDMGRSKERKGFKAKHMRIGFSIFFKKYKPSWYAFLWKIMLVVESVFRPGLKIS